MPIPTCEGRRTYFFFADVEPKELMTFEEQDLLTLRAFVQDVFDVTNARRFHADKVSATETKPVWPPLHAALGTSEGQLERLTDAATSIRHGNTKSAAPRRRSREPRRDPRARRRRPPATRSARGRELVVGARPDVG